MDFDTLNSVHSGAADIQRLILLIVEKGVISEDRRNDIIRAANRIADLIKNV